MSGKKNSSHYENFINKLDQNLHHLHMVIHIQHLVSEVMMEKNIERNYRHMMRY